MSRQYSTIGKEAGGFAGESLSWRETVTNAYWAQRINFKHHQMNESSSWGIGMLQCKHRYLMNSFEVCLQNWKSLCAFYIFLYVIVIGGCYSWKVLVYSYITYRVKEVKGHPKIIPGNPAWGEKMSKYWVLPAFAQEVDSQVGTTENIWELATNPHRKTFHNMVSWSLAA